ncbi:MULTISPECIES: 4'-phosphopantetheinyl transferase superfamily protein [unclassified Streptomyces]|uniref:4'-phosphopantetheinyl transferase superfamily protein n=1 Tax=unclassified Streptomyces TaxID=2593676 RepID=UPI003820E107
MKLLVVWNERPLSIHVLSQRERGQLDALPRQARTRWLVSRRALRLLLGLLGLPRDTAAYTFPHRRVSLSHVGSAAVAAGAEQASTGLHLRGVGVDLEPDRAARVDTSRFFLDEREQTWLASLPHSVRATNRMRLWTVKEALFKADPYNRHTVLRDYATADPAAHQGRAHARPHPITNFAYASARLNGGHLSGAVAFENPATPARLTSPQPESERPVPALTFADVAERVTSTLSVPVEKLTPETKLRELAADSFLLVEMAVDLQEEFDTVFTQHELREVTTLGELAALVGVRP